MRSILLAVALALSPLAAWADEAPEAKPRIYRWVDENGIAHYTTDEDRIPKSLRRRFGLPTQPLANEPLDAGAPAAETPPAPSGVDAWASQEKGALPAAGAAPGAAPTQEWNEGEAEAPGVGTAPPLASATAARLEQIELRIAELSAAIAADEDALTAWIGDPNAAGAIEVGEQPEFREIAKRLPKRLQELEALRRERDALVPATP
jgi:hypothetical protein